MDLTDLSKTEMGVGIIALLFVIREVCSMAKVGFQALASLAAKRNAKSGRHPVLPIAAVGVPRKCEAGDLAIPLDRVCAAIENQTKILDKLAEASIVQGEKLKAVHADVRRSVRGVPDVSG